MTTDEQIGRIQAQIEETVEELQDLAEELDDLDPEDDDEDQDNDEDSDDEDDDSDDDDDEDDEAEEPGDPSGLRPIDVLPALKTWTISFPTGKQGSPTNLYPPKIGGGTGIEPGMFEVAEDAGGRGVLFTAPVKGVTTPNSKRTRSEARWMADDDWTKAAFNGAKPHKLTARLWGSTEDLKVRKSLSLAQIHDGGDDVCQVRIHRAEGYTGLCLFSDDGDTIEEIDPDYRDRQVFDLGIETGASGIIVTYISAAVSKTLRLNKSGTSWYYKLGPYNQTSISEHGEDPSSKGLAMVYSMAVTGDPLG